MWIPRYAEARLRRSVKTRPVVVLTGARQTGKTSTLRRLFSAVDFVIDRGGRLELFEAKWTELPGAADTVNLTFVREALGRARVAADAVVCRAPNTFPLSDGFRALNV